MNDLEVCNYNPIGEADPTIDELIYVFNYDPSYQFYYDFHDIPLDIQSVEIDDKAFDKFLQEDRDHKVFKSNFSNQNTCVD